MYVYILLFALLAYDNFIYIYVDMKQIHTSL